MSPVSNIFGNDGKSNVLLIPATQANMNVLAFALGIPQKKAVSAVFILIVVDKTTPWLNPLIKSLRTC